jgi:hypothetical protein
MTSFPPNDPLIDLWQTAPKPDPQNLLRDLERLKRLHLRLNRSVLAILVGFSLLLIFEEASSRIATRGVLSVAWILSLVIGAVWQRRARCRRLDALTLDTISLLKSMLARAKSDLFIARCLYAGVPLGALAGFLALKLAGIGASPSAKAIDPRLHMLQTGAGVAVLIAMMVAGIVLERSRRLQVHELSEKLKGIEADL